MRTLSAVLIGIVLLPALISNPDRIRLPTVSAEIVTLATVRRASETGAVTAFGASGETLVVDRPVGGRASETPSVFVVDDDTGLLRRVPVRYGHATPSSIHIVSGVSPGARIVVSDMRAWDAFDRLRVR